MTLNFESGDGVKIFERDHSRTLQVPKVGPKFGAKKRRLSNLGKKNEIEELEKKKEEEFDKILKGTESMPKSFKKQETYQYNLGDVEGEEEDIDYLMGSDEESPKKNPKPSKHEPNMKIVEENEEENKKSEEHKNSLNEEANLVQEQENMQVNPQDVEQNTEQQNQEIEVAADAEDQLEAPNFENQSVEELDSEADSRPTWQINAAEHNDVYRSFEEQDKQDLTKYILKNREVTNPVVRAAEVDQMLFRNQRLLSFSKKTILQLFLSLLYIPAAIPAWLTVYPVTKREFSKLRVIVSSIFLPPFFFLVATYGKILDLKVISITFAIGLLLSITTFFLVRKKQILNGNLKRYFYFVGFCSGAAWIWVLSDLTVSIIKTLHILFNYQYIFMMLALFSYLAWFPMSLGSIQTVKLLHDMPGYTVAVFNCLFVFGLSSLIQTSIWGDLPVAIWPKNSTGTAMHSSAYMAANLTIVVLTLLFVTVNKGRFNSMLGFVLVAFYNIGLGLTVTEGIFSKD